MGVTFRQYFTTSGLAVGAVFALAYEDRGQFYTACVLLTRSALFSAVLANFLLALLVGSARALQSLFFGTLTVFEAEQIWERLGIEVVEVAIALTQFQNELDQTLALWFSLLLAAKVFHWLVAMRINMLEQAPAIGLSGHLRLCGALALLAAVDMAGTAIPALDYTHRGPSTLILFGFEFAVLGVRLTSSILRYLFVASDLALDSVWQHRSAVLFAIDFALEALQLGLYVGLFVAISSHYGMPVHIVRDLYLTARSLAQRWKDIFQYLTLTAHMDRRYPNATAEDLAGDALCIVCREDMTPGPQAKKLPCGHIFHLRCLRQWAERQAVCPTCRAPLNPRLATPVPPQQPRAAPPPAPPPAPQPPEPPVAPPPQQQQQTYAAPPPYGFVPPPPPFPFTGLAPPPIPAVVPPADQQGTDAERQQLVARLQQLREMHARLDLLGTMVAMAMHPQQ